MNNAPTRTHHALTIAGSDSCGGAGIQADIKVINSLGVEAASALTAITAQNTAGVRAVAVMAPDMVRDQLEAVFEELPITAAKTGMLANAGIIEAVLDCLASQAQLQLVVDPVMVATSGARLLDGDAEAAMRDRLLPRAALVTPNLPEAAALTGLGENLAPEKLGEALLKLGCKAVLIKGGHAAGDQVEDLLLTESGTRRYTHTRRKLRVHGTGCALSAAITAFLARGETLESAVDQAIAWLQLRLAGTWTAAAGELAMLPFANR
ncbi:MAG: bifunctional hydroxymethylpyrimidine kinase/phosphomethylpyrimidine kinase [Wenzhouxiangella sp.]|nr:MAG: bifunctional hydroxymethylpyrimidine kinase/phosphomethylpyrimidine kinase [Wenzhouxiangella sp.]